jgi:hypothetical protein
MRAVSCPPINLVEILHEMPTTAAHSTFLLSSNSERLEIKEDVQLKFSSL